MKKVDRFSAMLIVIAALCVSSSPALAFDSIPVYAIKSVSHALSKIRSKFSKKKLTEDSATETTIEVEPKKTYSVTINQNQRLALMLDANDGRVWNIVERPDKIAEEKPEGKASVTHTTIFFTPKAAEGEGDIVLKTKISENYPEDWSNADTATIHLTVRNAP